MEVEELIAELRNDYHKLDDMGFIDPMSVYRWVDVALKKFGGAISVETEAIVRTKNKQCKLPQDFFDLVYAYRCEPLAYETKDRKDHPELQYEIGWKERTERGHKWCSCTECCKEEFEKTIVEKIYFKGVGEVKFHYHKPILLHLGSNFKKDMCLNDERNMYVKERDDVINIAGNTLYAMFDGPIYLRYRGTPIDEEGKPYIPDSQLGGLSDYIETYVKMRLFEVVAANGEMQGAGDLYKLFVQQEMEKRPSVMREVKMNNITPESLMKMAEANKRRVNVYNNMFPKTVGQHLKFV